MYHSHWWCWRPANTCSVRNQCHSLLLEPRKLSTLRSRNNCSLLRLLVMVFRTTLRQSRPNKASLNCPFVCTYIRPSTKRFFDFDEIWHVDRGRWEMYDSMQYDLNQGQGHEHFRVGHSAILKSDLLRHLQWELATDHWFLN